MSETAHWPGIVELAYSGIVQFGRISEVVVIIYSAGDEDLPAGQQRRRVVPPRGGQFAGRSQFCCGDRDGGCLAQGCTGFLDVAITW